MADPEKKEILKEGINLEKEVKLWSVITAYEGECYRISSLKTEIGMISHKMSLITIFGHMHFKQKSWFFHQKISTVSDFGSYLE